MIFTNPHFDYIKFVIHNVKKSHHYYDYVKKYSDSIIYSLKNFMSVSRILLVTAISKVVEGDFTWSPYSCFSTKSRHNKNCRFFITITEQNFRSSSEL